MYMIITYDVGAKRTEKFKKLLRGFLMHVQYSVFAGDITEAKAILLRRKLSQLMIADDRIMEISTANRKNMDVYELHKSPNNKGEIQRKEVEDHKRDFAVL